MPSADGTGLSLKLTSLFYIENWLSAAPDPEREIYLEVIQMLSP